VFSETNRANAQISDWVGPFECGWEQAGTEGRAARQSNTIDGVVFRSNGSGGAMASPQIYVDPSDRNTVCLSFTGNAAPDCARALWMCSPEEGAPTWFGSVITWTNFVCKMSRVDFIRQHPNHTIFFTRPELYSYRPSPSTPAALLRADGGLRVPDGGLRANPPKSIPTSAAYESSVPGCGGSELVQSDFRFQFLPVSGSGGPVARTLIFADPFVFFDSFNNNDRWLFYTWSPLKCDDNGFNGNHTAAYPLETNELCSTASTASILPVAYRHNEQPENRFRFLDHPSTTNTRECDWQRAPAPKPQSDPLPGVEWMWSGFLDAKGLMEGMPAVNALPGCNGPSGRAIGYAEGPGAFNFENFTYVYCSRNAWATSGYSMWYRRVSRTSNVGLAGSRMALENDGSTSIFRTPLPFPNDPDLREKLLLLSNYTSGPQSAGYGHGEMFWGPGRTDVNSFVPRRPYLLYHAKDPQQSDRTAFFKELHFTADGFIQAIDDPRTGPAPSNRTWDSRDPRVFLIPWRGTRAAGQIGDFDGSGEKTTQDLFSYLEAYFSLSSCGIPSRFCADTNRDGQVALQDLFDFISDYFVDPWTGTLPPGLTCPLS